MEIVEENLKSKIKLDILLKYPLCRYRMHEHALEGNANVWSTSGITEDEVKKAHNENKIFYDERNGTFFVYPEVSYDTGKLTIRENNQLKILALRDNSLRHIVAILSRDFDKWKDTELIVDFSGVKEREQDVFFRDINIQINMQI